MIKKMSTARFKRVIRDYHRRHGRDMPWRRTRDPYRILISEIMLQQTQVARVVKFYPFFIGKFPNFRTLAQAKTADVLRAWQGMGYNRRALALQRLSSAVLGKFDGELPHGRAELESLPGIGKATAGAIRAFVWNEPEVFIETNIRRVFIHFFFSCRSARRRVTDQEIARYIKRTLPRKNVREWYWALMDYGAMLGAMSRTGARDSGRDGQSGVQNPNRKSAYYKTQPRFLGSDRELRGKILRILLFGRGFGNISRASLVRQISRRTKEPPRRVRKIVHALAREGFVT